MAPHVTLGPPFRAPNRFLEWFWTHTTRMGGLCVQGWGGCVCSCCGPPHVVSGRILAPQPVRIRLRRGGSNLQADRSLTQTNSAEEEGSGKFKQLQMNQTCIEIGATRCDLIADRNILTSGCCNVLSSSCQELPPLKTTKNAST